MEKLPKEQLFLEAFVYQNSFFKPTQRKDKKKIITKKDNFNITTDSKETK